jgi:TPR repeat protein
MKLTNASSLGFLLLVGVSCGPGAAAEKVRPKDPTASAALGEPGACHQVERRGEPLVVDWKPEQRGDLEELMHDGIAVVAYSCDGIKLLKDCKLEGSYGYLGMTKREQLVRLENSDEVRANLPTLGGGLSAKIGGELARGSTLDVAMVMVGKRRTTWKEPSVDDLKGTCQGATHFVRSALVGAFVMETGTKAKVRAAAEILGAGAEAQSSSDKSTRNQEGDPKDCSNSSPDATKPPAQCGAAVRLELLAIAPAGKGDAKPTEAPPASPARSEAPELTCPKDLVLTEGKCAQPAAAKSFLCATDNAAQCAEQCGKGNAGSCVALAVLHQEGRGAARDEAKAFSLFKQGCDGGEVRGCLGQGQALASGRGATKDPAAALPLLEKTCKDGVAAGCGALGALLASGDAGNKDEKAAVAALTKACDGGDDVGCGLLGEMTVEGRGTAADKQKAAIFFGRACQGSVLSACEKVGGLRESNNDAIGASIFYRRACFGGVFSACTGLGRLQQAGKAMPESEAKRSFERACNFGRDSLACAVLRVSYGSTLPVMDVARSQQLQRSCDTGVARDCAASGVFDVASGVKPMGLSKFQRACSMGDAWGCVLQKTVKLAPEAPGKRGIPPVFPGAPGKKRRP